MSTSYVDRSLGGFLELVAAREPAPGGGAVAAVTVSLAAGLVAMTARFSDRLLSDSQRVVADAERLRRRAVELADADAQAFRAVLAAREAARAGDATGGRERVRAALEGAALVPLDIVELGAETATLAARLVAGGNPNLHGDAVAAVLLAEAAVRSAAHLVRINVREGGCEEELLRRAARSTEVAAEALHSIGTLR